MCFCKHGNAVRADLVGDVTVGCYAVGANNNRINPALGHDHASHVVADQRNVDASLMQLESG
ncbi:hypothetical protein D3C84_1039020 [compost metagenome]